MEIEEYKQLDNGTKALLTDWFVKTGEVLQALQVDGVEKADGVRLLRSVLSKKNIKYLDK